MKFFDEMLTKYGFKDGTAIPEGATIYREVYLRVMNALLDKHKSKVRLVAYDRPGVHNPVMIRYVPYDVYKDLTDNDIYSGEYYGFTDLDVSIDNAYAEAVIEAIDAEVDDFVRVHVELNKEKLEKFIATIYSGEPESTN